MNNLERYHFYGAENAEVFAVDHSYRGIRTPYELYDALKGVWNYDTCSTRMKYWWTPEKQMMGHCNVTSLLIQDIFGGEIFGVQRSKKSYHTFNVVDGHIFDLTSEQFTESNSPDYSKAVKIEREYLLRKDEIKDRYELLKKNLHNYLG